MKLAIGIIAGMFVGAASMYAAFMWIFRDMFK